MSTQDTMMAVRLHAYGGPETLVYERVARPVAEPGQVLVRVGAVGVNPVDWKTRAGRGMAGNLPQPPLITGWDIAGRVVALGEGVREFSVGDAVFGMVGFPGLGAAYAEYVAAPAGHLAHAPASADELTAAALPLAALTVWQALFDAADLRGGQRALIHAAAGGVGHLAVQLARWKGAYVIGVASARNHGFLRELGAAETIDYTAAPFESQVADVDVVLDAAGGDTTPRSYAVLRPGGIVVSIAGGGDQAAAAARGVRSASILVKPSAAQLAEIARLVDAGLLRPTIDRVLPLSAAAEAHAYGELGRTRGKIVLRVAEN
jgi:NADPH:quinone reductase-like Zn-dependent oxidoreductase